MATNPSPTKGYAVVTSIFTSTLRHATMLRKQNPTPNQIAPLPMIVPTLLSKTSPDIAYCTAGVIIPCFNNSCAAAAISTLLIIRTFGLMPALSMVARRVPTQARVS